jgi:aromatic ring-cleaving dioxygenase
MAENKKWRGGVVISDERHSRGLIELLAAPVREQIDLTYYSHPYNVEIDPPHDFIVIFSLDDLRSVIRFYDTKRSTLPLLVHVASPDDLRDLHHDKLFPGVRILGIPQAPLDAEPGVTLEINLFARIIDMLRK